MSENQFHADDEKVSALLRQSALSPTLPPRFHQNVWHRIESADVSTRSASWLDSLAVMILRPRFAYAAIATLMLAGIFLGAWQGRDIARHDAQMNYLTSVAPNPLH